MAAIKGVGRKPAAAAIADMHKKPRRVVGAERKLPFTWGLLNGVI